jgi:tRNA-splicing ligase RtcB (3'-phosphate/5'-hydroxy nucleic acid ligase)
MLKPNDIIQISPFEFEIPKEYNSQMRVPARFFADESMLATLANDRSLEQLVNTAMLPGVIQNALAMPDMHQGYGFPIGGVVATELPDGIISPGGVGYDINCGIRLIASHLEQKDITPYLKDLLAAIYFNCPSGVGKAGQLKLNSKDLKQVMETGSKWTLKRGYATEEDLHHTEEAGTLESADSGYVSQRAKDRGRNQLGTLGSGNHFIEFDIVQKIFDPKAAQRMGLFKDQVVIQVHSGSRGLGHQVCSDYVKLFQKERNKHAYQLPDRELVCAPLSSSEGKAYLGAMQAAANYAYTNRQMLTYQIRQSFMQVLAGKIDNIGLPLVYDIAHNMAKIEEHEIKGKKHKLCVHRKGATRAFGPKLPQVSAAFRDIGQPVLVPGSMGTSSWVLLGTAQAMQKSFGSTCHGAGRLMSRSKAKKTIRGADLKIQLENKGIHIMSNSMSGLAEEAPAAYKDVNQVVNVVVNSGLATKVAKLTPIAVIKG